MLMPRLKARSDCGWTLVFNHLFPSFVRSSCLALKLLPVFFFFFFSETFSFVLTGEDGSRWFGYCKKLVVSTDLCDRRGWPRSNSQTRNFRNTVSG